MREIIITANGIALDLSTKIKEELAADPERTTPVVGTNRYEVTEQYMTEISLRVALGQL